MSNGFAPGSFVIRVARAALEAVLPAVCSDCGKLFRLAAGAPVRPAEPAAVDDWFRFLLRSHLCPGCMQRFKAVASPMCPRCGEPYVSPHGLDHLCGVCQAQPPRFMAARSAGHYEGPLRALIHHYKYLGRERLGEPLGRLLWQVLRRDWEPESIDRVLPVPLHPRRMRQRGFNQAHTLIRRWPALARASGARVAKHWVDARVLTRCRPTPPQTGLTKTQRADNLTHAFAVRIGTSVAGQRIVVVDDVLTTGATADACARVLLEQGAADVRVLTVARAV